MMGSNYFISPVDLKEFLREDSENILSTILNKTPDIIYVADLDTRSIVYINATVREILGLTQEEVYKKGFDFFPDLVHPHDYLKRMEQMSSLANQTNGDTIEIEVRMMVRDGSYHWFKITERIFNANRDGRPEKMVGIATDIDKQKRADQEVKKMTKQVLKKNQQLTSLNSDLESFNRIATHEFIETLQTIYTALEFIATKDAEKFDNSHHANIRRAQSHVQKLRLMAHDVTAYLQLNKFNPNSAPVDLNSIVNHAITKLPDNQVQLSLQSATLPWITGDPILLTILFWNVFDNAVKFRKEDEPPFIKVHYFKADEINFHSHALKDTSYHVISIRDNGIGFEQEEAERIFRIFYRIGDKKKSRGSGIGLSKCKKIMELHGGFIEAESSPGEGATFSCYFPEDSGGDDEFEKDRTH